MKIYIYGKRGSGKTTLAIIIQSILRFAQKYGEFQSYPIIEQGNSSQQVPADNYIRIYDEESPE